MLVALKGEIIWAVYICNGMQTHAITSSALRDVYFLCEVQGNKLVKTKKKSPKPMELEHYIDYLKG